MVKRILLTVAASILISNAVMLGAADHYLRIMRDEYLCPPDLKPMGIFVIASAASRNGCSVLAIQSREAKRVEFYGYKDGKPFRVRTVKP